MYKRILLKLSGESLGDIEKGRSFSPESSDYIATEIAAASSAAPQTQIGIVIGGGNIWRGARATGIPVDRVSADGMGMLATIINAMALRGALESKGVKAKVLTAVNVYPVAEYYSARKAMEYFKAGYIVIFAGGTGSPFFTTDTGASLRAAEIGAEIIFKATQVDGVYSADPKKYPDAEKYDTLSYSEALSKGLKIMDASALSMCLDNKISTLVFNLHIPGNIRNAVTGQQTGTIIKP